jgi:FixJ family two-component response regulator
MIVDRIPLRIDAIEIVRRLRQDSIVTPTLIVSALSEIGDRVRGLHAGGDDYLVKPFALVELLPVLTRWPAVAPPWQEKPSRHVGLPTIVCLPSGSGRHENVKTLTRKLVLEGAQHDA